MQLSPGVHLEGVWLVPSVLQWCPLLPLWSPWHPPWFPSLGSSNSPYGPPCSAWVPWCTNSWNVWNVTSAVPQKMEPFLDKFLTSDTFKWLWKFEWIYFFGCRGSPANPVTKSSSVVNLHVATLIIILTNPRTDFQGLMYFLPLWWSPGLTSSS